METNNKTQESGYGSFFAHHTLCVRFFDEVAIFNVDLSKKEIGTIRTNGLKETLGLEQRGKLATTWANVKAIG